MTLLEIIIIILYASTMDGVRDGLIHSEWWPRHIAKWAAFYPPLIYLLVKFVNFGWVWIVIVLMAWLFWQLGMRLAGQKWESMWIKALREIWQRIK